jgi:hypothetical protein
MNRKLAQDIATTWEMLNGHTSDPVKELLLDQFSQYDDAALSKALKRCRSECRGRITPADVIQRIDNGRPGAEEAWAIIEIAIRDERVTVVWTDEITEAYSVVRLMQDDISARMAFKETYERLCVEARTNMTPVKWSVSLGSYDGRSAPLLEAVRLGRISAARARILVPELPPMPGETKQLPQKEQPESKEKIKQLCAQVTGGKGIE